MDDQSAWEQAVAAAGGLYAGLSSGVRGEVDALLAEIMQLKEQLLDLATSAGSPAACSSCGGECCLLGRLHVTPLDILAYLNTGTAPVVPDFSARPACPYSNSSGCLMPPRYRPVTCVIFNCQLIEERMTPDVLEQARAYERRLRECVSKAEKICGTRLGRPLLLSCS